MNLLTSGAAGMDLFQRVTYLNLAAILIAGAFSFPTMITEEREEATLELLRMTGLSDLFVVVGKYIPQVLNVLFFLILQIPFTLLAVTLGGVSSHQVIATYACLCSFVCFFAAVGLFFSTIAKRTMAATIMTIGAVAVLVILPMGVGAYFNRLGSVIGSIGWFLNTLSPYQQLESILKTGFNGAVFSDQVILSIVGTLMCVLASWGLFGWFSRDHIEASPAQRKGVHVALIGRGSRRGGRAWNRPIVWKDFNFVAGGWRGLVWRVAAYIILIVITAMLTHSALGKKWMATDSAEVATIVLLIGLGIEIVGLAFVLFWSEVRTKTLGSLILTPFSVRRIMAHKVIGAMAGLVPVLLLTAICYLLTDSVFKRDVGKHVSADRFWLWTSIGLLGLYFLAYFSIARQRWAVVMMAVLYSILGVPLLMIAFMILGMAYGGYFFGIALTGGLVVLAQLELEHRLKISAAE